MHARPVSNRARHGSAGCTEMTTGGFISSHPLRSKKRDLSYWQMVSNHSAITLTNSPPPPPRCGPAGYGKTISSVVIGLKTAKGTKQLKLDPSIYESLQKEKVEVGDVIYIEANSGSVKRQGRSDTFASEYDLEVGSDVIMAVTSAGQ